ncbi:Sulfotransferase family cytosolic 1B member 1 [Armadillidium nasatum]|uniref:Sulfotransferase family cytosolic 1B member 1 n=1 Tax=Armadillidium nasatum TaxID=96803 RepID=A0A5N5TCB0_9CRUS|nr:Sulfotransferase family cytosolic 1B member 1 [Armadillidium nasatum]
MVDDNLFKSRISLYRYKGFIFPGEIILSGILQELPKFQFRENDVIVASFPKSGTTWVQEIVYMLTHNLEKSDDSSEVLETRFPYLEYPYPGIKSIAKQKGQRHIKTHLPATILPPSFVSSGAKLIYITRNPKDTIVSYWHFVRLLSTVSFIGSFREFLQLFLSDKVPYGPFYDHLRTYFDLQKTQNVLIITYEDLKENPIQYYLQVPVTDSEAFDVAVATTFRSMSENKSVNYEHWKDIGFANKNEGKFLRKGVVGDWKNYFTPEMLKDFESWRIKNEPDEICKFKNNL